MKLSLPLKIEVPQNPLKFKLGLMFRENLEQDSGMLFIFDEVGEKSFHMRNTTIPLDIAFINEEGIIESIKELKPLEIDPVCSDTNVLYALEVNKGWFAENNVKVGDKIFESDLDMRKRELRLKQLDQLKKWKPNTTAIQKERDKEQMKKEIKQELQAQESVDIENSDGQKFADITDIIGPANMQPVVSNGLWKGTEQIMEQMPGEDKNGDKEQDPQKQQVDAKQKKADLIKKQVLLKKLQAVRQGGGENIVASYDWKSDKSMRINKVAEGSLHKWFKGSKSKDGKPGWVNVKSG